MLKTISVVGKYIIFVFKTFLSFPQIIKRSYEFSTQVKKMGFDSLMLVSVTSAFTGLVTAVQASYQTKGYIPQELIGVMVGKSTMIELAPVLTALVLSGKIGASIAAEIGTMEVSEQLDAMKSIGTNPVDFLYLPRVLSGLLIFPLLTVYANLIAITSAFIVSNLRYGVNAFSFFINMKNYFEPLDLWGGLAKSFFFGFIVTSVGCFAGQQVNGGAEGVGKAATATVVYSSILILVMDFIVAALIFGG